MGEPRLKDVEEANDQKNKLKGQNGINMNDRKCTDILCCLSFMIFILGMIAISAFAFSQGNPSKILTKFDSDGNQCGAQNQNQTTNLQVRDFSQYQYKYFVNINPQPIQNSVLYYISVCTTQCPQQGQNATCLVNSQVSSCPNQISVNTYSYLGYCLPDLSVTTEFVTQTLGQINTLFGSSFSKYIVDVTLTWPLILIVSAFAFIFTIIYFFLLKWVTKPLIYLSIVNIFICGVIFTVLTGYKASQLIPGSDDYKGNIAAAVAIGVGTLIYMIIIGCLWPDIKIGTSIMEASGDFMSSNLKVIVVPIIATIMFLPFILWWAATIIYLFGMGTPIYVQYYMFSYIQLQPYQNWLLAVLIFGLFWIILFQIALVQFTIATTSCIWYFSGQGSDQQQERGSVSIFKGLGWAFYYHIGSLAFGSFLLALISFFRASFEYFCKKFEMIGQENCITKCITCSIRCCLCCLDCCCKFLTENAYVQVALNSFSFCEGAQNAFYLMVRNPGTYSAMTIVGYIMAFIGKGLISGLSGWITYICAQKWYQNVQQPVVPAIVVAIAAYLIASLFICLFDFASLTILQCFLVNIEMGGTVSTPDSLKPFIEQVGKQKQVQKNDSKVDLDQIQIENKTNTNEAQVNKLE